MEILTNSKYLDKILFLIIQRAETYVIISILSNTKNMEQVSWSICASNLELVTSTRAIEIGNVRYLIPL